jgi:hypothetical protein
MSGFVRAADSVDLLTDIRAFCEAHGVAETTFGRLAANDGKLVGRMAAGSVITSNTAARLRAYMAGVASSPTQVKGRPRRKHTVSTAAAMAELSARESGIRTVSSFAFHEQRQRHLVFSGTTNEAAMVADRAAVEIRSIKSRQPGMRLFISPMDDGLAINRLLRSFHRSFPGVPVLVVIRGRGLEELHSTTSLLIDRITENPLTVVVLTNLYMREAVRLQKLSDDCPHDLVWREVALRGSHSLDFQEQLEPLYPQLADEWQVHRGRHGQPVYDRPSVLVLYREDRRFLLEPLLPRPDTGAALRFDYCLLNRPYLHSHPMSFRIEHVLAPMAEQLEDGGCITVLQSAGDDPAHEIVRRVWPRAAMEFVRRHDVIAELRRALGERARDFTFRGLTDTGSLFRFDMLTLPRPSDQPLGALSLASAWNNAVYFAQVRNESVQQAMSQGSDYLEATREVIEENRGLWFLNESFSFTRRSAGGAVS